MWWVEDFHKPLDGLLSMPTVYSYVQQVNSLVLMDFERVYFYRDWDGWVKYWRSNVVCWMGRGYCTR